MTMANNFCSACGKKIIETAVICPGCGSPTSKYNQRLNQPSGKKKSIAVLLAIFFGYWTYLYTFQKDKAKFFSWLGIYFITSLFCLGSVSTTHEGTCYDSAYQSYSCHVTDFNIGALTGFSIVVLLGWLIALVDVSSNNQSYYDKFSV